VYFVEQNDKVSSSYVYHSLYFTHKLKKNIIKPHRKKNLKVNYRRIIKVEIIDFSFVMSQIISKNTDPDRWWPVKCPRRVMDLSSPAKSVPFPGSSHSG